MRAPFVIRFALALAACAAALGGCSRRSTLTDGRFVVGFDADFPPYGYKDGAEYKGFDLDLARAVCEKRGWTFVANPINWDAKDMELNAGAIDCIWNGFTMQGREDAYTWSCAYVDNSQVVLVKMGSPIRTLADLSGKTVGVQADTPVQKALSGLDKGNAAVGRLGKTFKSLVIEPNYNQAINELDASAVDAVAMDIGVAKRKMADLPGKFALLNEIVMSETYGIGFRRGNVELCKLVEESLRELSDDGTMKVLAGKYGIEEESLILWQDREDGGRAEVAPGMDFAQMLVDLLGGLAVSMEIFFLTLLFALPLGFAIAFGRMARNPALSGVFRMFISIVRGTPLMLQIMFIYFAPYMFFGLPLSGFPRLLATVIAFSLNYAAYFAEIYRGGILSIDRGQTEAAVALGMQKGTCFFRIILPQVVKRVVPAVGNEVITLVKDTSLAFTIAVTEMFTIAKQLSSANTTLVPLVAAGAFYYIFNFIVAWTMNWLERRLAYYD